MDKFRKARSKILAVAKFPTPKSEQERLRLAEEQARREAEEVPKTQEAETQTETAFPSWIHVWEEPNMVEERELLRNMLSFHYHHRPYLSTSKDENKNFDDHQKNHIIFNSASEREYMRRLHCQEYKTLQQLRDVIRQHLTDLGTSVYDLCAFKDIALTMKEKTAIGPINDLVLMSSKLFRRTSDLSRSLATLFTIMFADEFCDRDFDFTDQRMTKLALRRTEQELESVTNERNELKKRCHDAESKLYELTKSQSVLKQQRDEAESRYSTISQDMALLFQKSIDDITKYEMDNLKSADLNLDAHNLVAPARSIAQQSIDNAMDKLSNVVQGLKSLQDDVAQIDFGGAMRTNLRNMDQLVNNCLTKLTHVRDGIRTSADTMRQEIAQRKKAVELSVLHVLAAEKMRAKIRQGREVLNAVREKAILCSDLVRSSRIHAVERKQEHEKKLLEDFLEEQKERDPNAHSLTQYLLVSQSTPTSPLMNNNNSSLQQQQQQATGNQFVMQNIPMSTSRPPSGSQQQKTVSSSNPPRSTSPPVAAGENSSENANNNKNHWSVQPHQVNTEINNNATRKPSPPVPFENHNFIHKQPPHQTDGASRKNSTSLISLLNSAGVGAANTSIGGGSPNESMRRRYNSQQVIIKKQQPVFVMAPESFDQADEFSMHMTNLISTISNAASMLSHEDELSDIVDSLTCVLPQAGVSKGQQQQSGGKSGGGASGNGFGREVLDSAIEALHASTEGGILNSGNSGAGAASSSSTSNSTTTAFKQFAEMAQFMREMFEERIRELEESKGFGVTTSTSTDQQSSSSPSSSSPGNNNNKNTTDAALLASKTEAELLEDQAVKVLEGWRRRRRGETNLGRIQIADALRELDSARKERKKKHEEEVRKTGVHKRFEFGRQRSHGDDDGGDANSDDDVAEAPSLVIDVSEVKI